MNVRALALAIAIGLVLSGCSLTPRESLPDLAVPARYATGDWQPAAPADDAPRGAWWQIYRDPDLDALEGRLLSANADLGVAVARLAEARATAQEAAAGLWPTLGVGGLATRDRQSDTRPLRSASQPATYRDYALTGGASYEVDLWGRVRSLTAIGRATAAAVAGDLESARLSLTAELANEYLIACGLDEEGRLLDDTVAAYRRALNLAQTRHDGGLASGLDVARAEAQLDSAIAQHTDLQARRALVTHAIARLVGEPASRFVLAPRTALPKLPNTPAGVPGTLAERRPDIAAAERRVAAANAAIGLARSAFFPRVVLGALGGYESTSPAHLVTTPNRLWAVGPVAALSLFDGGARRAASARARAARDEATEHYRATTLAAFEEVEDNLALLSLLATEAEQQGAAVKAAEQALKLAENRYREGAVSSLEVVIAQTAALTADRTALDLRVRRLVASVGLVRGLGGTWDPRPFSAPPANTPAAASSEALAQSSR